MKICRAVAALVVVIAASLQAQTATNFSGKWVLNTAKSQNLGMMSTLEDTLTIAQTATELAVTDQSSFMGQQSSRQVHYSLVGKTTSNEGPMGDRNDTVAKWINGKLVTTWTRDGAVAGTKSVMTETRSLSTDGKTMSVESARGTSAPLVMVFEKR